MSFKLDVPKRVFDPVTDKSAHQFQTVTGGRNQIGVIGTRAFVDLPFTLPSYTTAQAEALPEETVAGAMIYVTDGDAGNPTLAVSNGTNWIAVHTNATISAT